MLFRNLSPVLQILKSLLQSIESFTTFRVLVTDLDGKYPNVTLIDNDY